MHVRLAQRFGCRCIFLIFFFRFAEMITGYPLFRGRDNADQLVQIMKIVGTPSDATIAQIKLNSVSQDILVRGG